MKRPSGGRDATVTRTFGGFSVVADCPRARTGCGLGLCAAADWTRTRIVRGHGLNADIRERPVVAGTAENERQLIGLLKFDDGFKAPRSGLRVARADPGETVEDLISLPRTRPSASTGQSFDIDMRQYTNCGSGNLIHLGLDRKPLPRWLGARGWARRLCRAGRHRQMSAGYAAQR